MWVLIVAVTAALVAYVALALWQGRLVSQALSGRDCPSCGAELQPVTDGPTPERSYEVLGCSRCSTVVTTVHGTRSQFAYCSSCRQLALEVRATPVGPTVVGDLPRVELQERCTLCGFEDLALLPEDGPLREGKVIPFPGPRSNVR